MIAMNIMTKGVAEMVERLLLAFVAWNVIAFAVMYLDKRRAQLGQWRISVARLLLLGLLMGASGLWLGMKLFKHKTQHTKFAYGIPALWVVNYVFVLGGYYFINI